MTQKRKKSKSRSKHQNQLGKNISDLLPSCKTDSGNKGDIVKVEHKTKECVEKDASKLLSSYQDAIVCRSIVELALLNILIGDNTCDNINTKVSNTNKATLAAMSGSGAGNSAANAQSNTGGLSKLQDLGRSLFGFLTGGNNGQNGEENGGQSKKSINASKHRESLDSNSGTTGRQRPASQVGSLVGTPILVHRKPPLQKDKQMSNNKTTAAVAQEIDNPVATKRKKKKNSIDNSNSNEVENKQNGEKSSLNVNAAKTKPPPSGKKRNRSASNKRRRMKAKEKASGAVGGDNENEDNEKDEHQDDNKSPSPHMVDNVDSTTKKGSIVNGKGSVAMITHNDKYDNNSKEPTHCHNQQNNIINKKPDKECEEETVFHSARNSVIIDNKLTRQDSELSSDKNEKYYSQENLSVKCSDDATEWRDGEKGEGCIDSAQREDSSHSCAQSAEVSCNNNLVGKKLPEQCKDLADVVQQNKLRGQGEVEPGDIHKLNINPQFNITRDTVNIKSTDIIKESLTEHETSDVKLTDTKEESGEEGLCGLSCEETITKISTSVNINPPSSDLLPPVGDKTSPPNSSQPLTPDINAPPTSAANTGATPPPAPPPPPPGYLTESIRVLSSSSASSKSSCRTEKQSKNSVDTSLKEFCKPVHGKKVKKTREELLLEQIAGVDDSFASFLRTQLNIIPVSRDRDDKAAENSSETNNTPEKRKPRRRRGDSECSESSVRSETTIKTTVAASGQSTVAAAPQTTTVSSLTVEEESKSGSSTPKQCQLENGAEIPSSQNTKDYEIESTYSTIPTPSDNNVVENKLENSANKTALNEKLESNLASSEEEKVQPSSEIDTSVDDNNCNTSTSIGQQEDIDTQEAQQDINMSASIDQNVLTEVSADISIDNVDAANNNVSTDDNTKNTSEIICDTTTTNNYITTEQPTPNIETDKKQTIITDNTKCEEGYSSMGGTHSSLETTTTTSTSPTSDLQSTSSCTEDHSSEENHHSDACYTENAPKDGEIVSMLSKSDSGYSGTSPKAARKKDISIDEAMKLYNRRVLGADNSLIAPPTVPTVVPPSKRNRIESEGSDYSDYTDSDSEYSEINDGTVTRRGVRETRSYNSRRSSTDSSEDGVPPPGSITNLKSELRDMEDKFKKAMVNIASLDNDKCQLMFQVDLLKDQVEEVEEQNSLIMKELRAKTHDYELLKRDHAESQRALVLLQQGMEQQQSMLAERGLILLGGDDDQEETLDEDEQEKRTRAIVSQETANILSGLGPGPLDVRIKRLARQRDDLQDETRRLKLDLEEEKSLSSSARGAYTQQEIERETKKILDDYKFKISKAEQENATLQATNARLESQVVRYKTAAETAESSEENLKSERRKMQRELRETQTKNEELETANKHLEKRLEKLKTAKSNLLQQL